MERSELDTNAQIGTQTKEIITPHVYQFNTLFFWLPM